LFEKCERQSKGKKKYINTQQSTYDFHTQGIPEISREEGSDWTV